MRREGRAGKRSVRSLNWSCPPPLSSTMDIPSYTSSGALTREHYVLVRNVELATSESAADQHIHEEAQAVRNHLGQSGLSSVRTIRNALSTTHLTRRECFRNAAKATLFFFYIAPTRSLPTHQRLWTSRSRSHTRLTLLKREKP